MSTRSLKKKSRQTGATVPSFTPLQDLFAGYQLQDKGGYITQEFQDFGYRLAMALDDKERVSLYMRLAKREKRGLLERALSFVSDAKDVKSKSRLFMWKLKELRKEEKEKKDVQAESLQLSLDGK